MTFRVGQKCVCIKQPDPAATARFPGSKYPTKDGIYKIRAINDWPDDMLLRFEELDNRSFEGVLSEIEPGFSARHFRPLSEHKSETSFTHGADPSSDQFDNRRVKVGAPT